MSTRKPLDFPLPSGLPEPVDDGAAEHLPGLQMPHVFLRTTSDRMIDVGALTALRTVIYCYPMTGVPGQPLPAGWDMIPGARGCTPQSCGFRDHYDELLNLRTDVFGLSTQTAVYQAEMVQRLAIPFEVLSDAAHHLTDALQLPTFTVNDMRLLKRLTLIVRQQHIEQVFYPVFPPDESAEQVIAWLRQHPIV